MKKDNVLTKGAALLTIAALILAPLVLTNSYAAHSANEVVLQLVYIKKETCHTPDLIVAQTYTDLTAKYLDLYQLSNTSLEPNCILASEFENFQKTDGVDLVVYVFDKEAGEKILQSNDLDGIYAHFGNDRLQNHIVIVCECSNEKTSYEAASTPWILSHELSHFVMYFKGYSKSAVQEVVHDIEKNYQSCLEALHVSEYCKDVRTTIRLDSTPRDFVVMTPYKAAVGNTLIKYLSDEIDSPTLELQRDITNMWVENSIDDEAFVETLKHLVDPPLEENDEQVLPYLQMSNGFVISEVVKNPVTDWKEFLNPLTQEEKLSPLLDYIPNQLEEQTEEYELQKFPNWFKSRALLWTEKRISDKVFFDGIEHLVRLGFITLN